MEYSIIAIGFVGFGVLVLVLSLYFFSRGQWFQQWLRGTLGLSLAALAVLVLLFAANLYSYQQLTAEKPVATLSIEKLQRQKFSVKIEEPNGKTATYQLYGDLWQLDARIIKWKGFLSALGMKPGYKLDRIQGRYLSIEDERSKERSVHALYDPKIGVDLWKSIQKNSMWFPLIDARYGSATYVPLKDGAIYAVNLSSTGLLARPLNNIAEKAIVGQ